MPTLCKLKLNMFIILFLLPLMCYSNGSVPLSSIDLRNIIPINKMIVIFGAQAVANVALT